MSHCVFFFLVAAMLASECLGFRSFNGLTRVRSSISPRMSSEIVEPVTIPATSFLDCVRQAVASTKKALAAGEKLLEVEFPPLPLEYLEDSSSSARDIADANTRWAIEFSKSFTDNLGQVTLLYPDDAELQDAIKYVDMEGGDQPFPNVKMASVRADSINNAKSIDQVLLSVFGARASAGRVEPIPGTKLYIALVSSTQELPDLENLHKQEPDIPIIFFNLRLDILRGDLGLPLFPTRDLHHRFLSKIKATYLMRSRAFATSLRRPPFIVNYSGLLFRAYPEPFQCILNVGDNRNKLVKSVSERPTNKDFRDALTDALKIPGVPKEELKTQGNLVWWEKETDKEQSDAWRK